jgi:hypothetical protein
MKHLRVPMIIVVAAALSVGMFQVAKPTPELSSLMPEGALLYVEAKDFGAIMQDWNSSKEKQAWLKSDTLSVFSRSRLYGRLNDAQEQFGEVAGVKPDMNLLGGSAGAETAFAWYDIGKLEFLYVSHVPSAKSMQNALWQARGKFEARKAGENDFYVKKNPETKRVVAFAVLGDYLVIGTKEELVAGAVQLISGKKDRTIRDEEWYAKSVASAGAQGDLRMVMNLTKIVPSSYFRTYWVQQNITDMSQYMSAVTDLHRGSTEYKEERVLLRNPENESKWTMASVENSKAVAEIAKLVPENVGFYKATAGPPSNVVRETLVTKILAPHLGAAPAEKIAPRVSLGNGQTGSESDFETRIDTAPSSRANAADSTTALDALLKSNVTPSMLVLHSTDNTPDGGFVNLRSCIVLRGTSDWDLLAAEEAVKAAVRAGLTASDLGVTWRTRQEAGVKFEQFDGLSPTTLAVQGKWLVIANNSADVVAVLGKVNSPAKDEAESYVAGFNHAQERPNYLRLVKFVDRKGQDAAAQNPGREPQFFSDNMASLSGMFEAVRAEKIIERDEGKRVLQTVTYEWSH